MELTRDEVESMCDDLCIYYTGGCEFTSDEQRDRHVARIEHLRQMALRAAPEHDTGAAAELVTDLKYRLDRAYSHDPAIAICLAQDHVRKIIAALTMTKNYSPAELYEVAMHTLVPKDFYKNEALGNLVRAFERPDGWQPESASLRNIPRTADAAQPAHREREPIDPDDAAALARLADKFNGLWDELRLTVTRLQRQALAPTKQPDAEGGQFVVVPAELLRNILLVITCLSCEEGSLAHGVIDRVRAEVKKLPPMTLPAVPEKKS